ncbi:dynamin, partial [Helicosporidium sp. ATCC 50920]
MDMLGQRATPLPSERAFRSGNEKLYEAYNDLHALAQDFEKPFDAPAILVVGHQTDGKSALVEALMGFQFNHVGGGTKTRRPITLHMKYDGSCVQPRCYAVSEEFGESTLSLEEMRSHIEAENTRLEREGAFWAKEMVFKIEYKFCPNLTIIDTPGLLSAAPGRRHAEAQASARAVEAMVRSKMEQREYILLCLEDCNDWANATTRRLVMQADPALARTVLVSTKLDTRVPQF